MAEDDGAGAGDARAGAGDDGTGGGADVTDAGAAPACGCKVGRSAAAYGRPELVAELRRRHADGASLRDLERFVNLALLRGALRRADVGPLGSVESVLAALVDDAGAGRRAEVRERLAQAGVDVAALEDAFVSYGTVRTHLRDCADVETGRRRPLDVEGARGTIEWARSRNVGVVERTLGRLRDAGELETGELELAQVTRVTCADCGASYPVHDLLERGRCACDE